MYVYISSLAQPFFKRHQYYYRHPNDCSQSRFLDFGMLWKYEQYTLPHIGMFDINTRDDHQIFVGPSTEDSWYPNGPRSYLHCGVMGKYYVTVFKGELWFWADGYNLQKKLKGNDASRWEYWFCRDNLTFACEATPVHPNTVYT